MKHPTPQPWRRGLLAALLLAAAAGPAPAAPDSEPQRAIEEVLASARQDRRGVTLYVAGQAVSGAVTHVEPGRWVELRNAQFGRIVVRLDRVDGIGTP